jgi:CheY-like chemotaxis protein
VADAAAVPDEKMMHCGQAPLGDAAHEGKLRLFGCRLRAKTDALTPAHDYAAYRLLIAEDVDINREVIASLLEQTGIGIDFAENGQIAVEKFCADPARYHLIFMDVQMPLMDGYEATKLIRAFAHENAKTIPILAMTANVFKEDIEQCRAAGMNGHLGKPIDMVQVFETLEQYLIG